jgi:hypothetical protein
MGGCCAKMCPKKGKVEEDAGGEAAEAEGGTGQSPPAESQSPRGETADGGGS